MKNAKTAIGALFAGGLMLGAAATGALADGHGKTFRRTRQNL